MALAAQALTSPKAVSNQGDGDIVCCIDLDNILHRGFDRQGRARKQNDLDVVNFAKALRNRGVLSGSVVRNRTFSLIADRMWSSLGFKVVAARRNCDEDVIAQAEAYAEAGTRQLVLCAGDAHYTGLVKRMRNQNVRVECWTRRQSASAKLMAICDGVRFIDSFLSAGADSSANDNTRLAGYGVNLSTTLQKLLIDFVSLRRATAVCFDISGATPVLRGICKSGRSFRLEINGDQEAWMEALKAPDFRLIRDHL